MMRWTERNDNCINCLDPAHLLRKVPSDFHRDGC